MTRRLAAIMFTDIAGYTALSQRDEPAALRLLHDQDRLVRGLLEVHRGRLVKSIGDGLLIEFANALDAVECAVDLQRHIRERNARELPPELRVRIGIHLGDVEGMGTDILGDAVNVASRIEPLAEPGGVCLSEPVYGLVRNAVRYQFEKLGPKTLKGVQEPVEIYRIALAAGVATTRPAPGGSGPPRLAILPLTNISPDPRDEYFADGLTEELISAMSQLRGLRVIARTSVNQFKGSAKSIAQIGSELEVSWVMEGSVRKAGDRLRVAVQLVDARSQEHIWANSYDRELEDIFAVQADVAHHVADALKIGLRSTEAARLEARPAVRPDSYLAYLKARTRTYDLTPSSLEAAREQFELAISLDPQNAAAYSGLADVTRFLGLWHTGLSQVKWDEAGRRFATQAVELDPNLAEGHASLAVILWKDSDYATAEQEFKLALSLNPSYAFAHHMYAALLMDQARTDEALQEHAMAEATDPLWPLELYASAGLLIYVGRLDEALVRIRRLGQLEPEGELLHLVLAEYYLARSDLRGCLAELQRFEETVSDPRFRPVIQALRHALSGDKEEARALLRKEDTLPGIHRLNAVIAWAYLELGDLDECFRWMERGLPFQQIRLDPRFERVRRDPRFADILKKKNLA